MKITSFTRLICKMEAKKGRQVAIGNMAEIIKSIDKVTEGIFYLHIKRMGDPKYKTDYGHVYVEIDGRKIFLGKK